ncbi:hypothetical protein FH966_13330 [Lentibacillus cibarius]|uniref:GerMN domain-containing protein n=1 Tax=Lentibacillus cibarius TaxID=2583219 RepID=A0A549YL47_9BACI|nr:hypothetical protein [Lentibacillus cibarius]TRM12601.1 hypothetical protein FH966_13330 [Lentibacillus cibarius]
MKQSGENEKRIKDALKQMPKIESNVDKDTLFQRVSSEINGSAGLRKHKRFAFIPVISTIMAIGLLLLLIPIINDSMIQNTNDSSTDQAMDNHSSLERSEHSEESSNDSQIMQDKKSFDAANNEAGMMNKDSDSLIVQPSDGDKMVIHGAVGDLQGQYIIPISLVVPESSNRMTYINKLDSYLQESKWGVSNYMFSDITFRIDDDNHQVNVKLPKDFSLQGSLKAAMFEGQLAVMFRPYGINKAVFKKQVNLGKIGKVKQLPLRSRKVIYKKYHAAENKRKFLAQVPINEQADFSQALAEMKKDEEPFNIYKTIPKQANLSVETNGSRLEIAFSNGDRTIADQKVITMIDAILMTAKNFGYKEVLFSNTGNDTVGPYDLTKPINVPLGANPVTPDS